MRLHVNCDCTLFILTSSTLVVLLVGEKASEVIQPYFLRGVFPRKVPLFISLHKEMQS